jgi:hypothetical protein
LKAHKKVISFDRRKTLSHSLFFSFSYSAWRSVFGSPGTKADVLSKPIKEEKEKAITIDTKAKVDHSRMKMEDVAIKGLKDHPFDEYDGDDDDCELGLSSQLSSDTASLTLKSSSSTETFLDEEAFGSPTRLRRRQHNSPVPHYGNEASHDDGVDDGVDDNDNKKRFHVTIKHVAQRRLNLMRFLLLLALVASCYFLWSSKTLDRMDLLATIGRMDFLAKYRWKMPSKQQARKLLHKIQRQPLRGGVTVRLQGDRIDLLLQSLDRLARCPSVENVQIGWGDQNKQAVPELLLYHKSRKVTPVGPTHTDAVLLLEESVQLSCEDLERAYREWMLDPVLLVGFLPFRERDEGSYALLSDHALFTHKLYLDSIENTTSLQSESHCQHLTFSGYVTALSSKSPVAIQSNLGRAAPSTFKSGSNEKECVKQITEATGLHSLPHAATVYVGHQYS